MFQRKFNPAVGLEREIYIHTQVTISGVDVEFTTFRAARGDGWCHVAKFCYRSMVYHREFHLSVIREGGRGRQGCFKFDVGACFKFVIIIRLILEYGE